MTESDIWRLFQAVADETPKSSWMCSRCWAGVAEGQTECYRCGAELHAHPQDERNEPWRQ